MADRTNNNSCCKECGSKKESLVKADFGNCVDICVTPIQGEPRLLTMLVPVIYDEVGFNLCKNVDLSETGITEFKTADHMVLEVLDMKFNLDGQSASYVEALTERPYCSRLVLSKILVIFSAKIFDKCDCLLGNIVFGDYYLNDESEDSEDNPEQKQIEIELYTPYGTLLDIKSTADRSAGKAFLISHAVPVFSFMGMTNNNQKFPQGIVVQALGKAGGINTETGIVSIGLTIIAKSIYGVAYKLPHAGIESVPKMELDFERLGSCTNFSEGELLCRKIKPLDLGYPMYEEHLKNDC